MARTFTTLFAFVLLAAGCVQTTAPPPGDPSWQLDCTLGDAERNLAGARWVQDCLARASHTSGQKQEMWLAVNPTDPDNVVVGAKDLNPDLSANCVWNGLFVTKDGGRTWTDVFVGGFYRDRTPESPYYGYACNTDPMGVFTPDGTLHWLIELYNLGDDDGFGPIPVPDSGGRGILYPGWKLVLARSTDGGLTFPDDQAVTLEYGDGVAMLNDYSRITNNPATGTTVTMINTFYPGVGPNTGVPVPVGVGGAFCSLIAFRGTGAPVQAVPLEPRVQTASGNPGGLFCASIASSRAGTLVVAAAGADGPAGTVPTAWFATSADDGATYGDFTPGFTYAPIPGVFEESTYRTGTNFELAFDNSDGVHSHPGRLYALMAERETEGGAATDEADITIRWSDDNGTTWTGPVRVNRDTTSTHQFMGNLAVAADGSVHVFYMDKAFDPQRMWIDVTHALSLDGGAAWTNERVTTVSWDGELGKHQEGFPFIGDYNGVGTAGNVVYAAFPDASNGATTVAAVAKVELRS